MRQRLLIALILASASGSVFAQASGLGNETGAPSSGDEDSAPAPKRTSHTPTVAETRKGPVRSDTQRNANPRWHSFLPGMFR